MDCGVPFHRALNYELTRYSIPSISMEKFVTNFNVTLSVAPPSDMEQCHYIETGHLPHRKGGTITAHDNEKVAYDVGSGIRIGDAFKAADYLDGSFFDMKMTPDGHLQGWVREVHGNKKENAFAGVSTLEQRGGVEPNFVSRFETIKRELLVGSKPAASTAALRRITNGA